MPRVPGPGADQVLRGTIKPRRAGEERCFMGAGSSGCFDSNLQARKRLGGGRAAFCTI